MNYNVKVDRLKQLVDPTKYFYSTPLTLEEVMSVPEWTDHNYIAWRDEPNGENYGRHVDAGRIRWLISQINNKDVFEPVTLEFDHSDPNFSTVCVRDGNHRLAAAILSEAKWISVFCEGEYLAEMEWLQGKSNKLPYSIQPMPAMVI